MTSSVGKPQRSAIGPQSRPVISRLSEETKVSTPKRRPLLDASASSPVIIRIMLVHMPKLKPASTFRAVSCCQVVARLMSTQVRANRPQAKMKVSRRRRKRSASQPQSSAPARLAGPLTAFMIPTSIGPAPSSRR